MNLFIDNKSGAPIYEQLCNQIKNQILSGALQTDEALPSIRGLARDLRISVITTKRAYDELEKEGFLYAIPAKGFFVAPKNTELLREENLKKIESHLTEAVHLAASCGLGGVQLRLPGPQGAVDGCEVPARSALHDPRHGLFRHRSGRFRRRT